MHASALGPRSGVLDLDEFVQLVEDLREVTLTLTPTPTPTPTLILTLILTLTLTLTPTPTLTPILT